MRPEIIDAIGSACTVEHPENMSFARRVMPQRRHNPEKVRAILYAVIRELPDDMTVAELRDELEITSVQGGM